MLVCAGHEAGATPQALGAPSLREIRAADGAISHCVMDQAYDNRMHVTIARRRDGHMNIGITVPEAGYMAGAHYPVRLEPADGEGHDLVAATVTDDMLLIDLGPDDAFVAQIAAHQIFTAIGPMDRMDFPLPEAAAMVERLDECAAQAGRALPPAIVELLQSAGLGDAVPIDLDALPDGAAFADFAWRRGDISGGVRQRESRTEDDFGVVVRKQLRALQKQCRGTWRQVLQKTGQFGAARQQRGLLTCGGADGTVMAILFHRAGDGRFSIIAHAGDAGQRPVIAAATATIAKILAAGAEAR